MFAPHRRPRPWARSSATVRSLLGAACVVGTLAVSRVGWAETPAENKAAARSLALEGLQLAAQGKCDEALPLFERAEALFHAPTILTSLGECQLRLGRLVAGTETLNRVVREELPADAPNAFRDAQARARALLDEARPKIAQLTLHVAPTEAAPRVLIDGVEIASAFLGVARPTDPGAHHLEITAEGFEPLALDLTLAEGARETLHLELEPLARDASPAPLQEPARPTTAQKTWGYVSLGVGAALLGAGAVTGAMALGKENGLKQSCPGGRCPESERSELEDARSLATIATVATVSGATLGVAGLVLLFTSSHDDEPARQSARAPSPRVTPWLGWNSLGVSGSF